MKPIIVNLPTFTADLLNDNADYCINVCFLLKKSNSESFFILFRLQKNFIIIINFVNHLICVKSMWINFVKIIFIELFM